MASRGRCGRLCDSRPCLSSRSLDPTHMNRFHLAAASALVLSSTILAQDDLSTPRSGTTVPTPSNGHFSAATSSRFALTFVYSNVPGHPSNLVPGLGLPFDPGGGSADAFRQPWVSPDGQQLVIDCDAATGSLADDNVYLLNGQVVLQEGQQAPWAPAGELVGPLDDRVGINSLGEIVVTNNTGGTAPTTADDYVVLFDRTGTWTTLAKEGDVVDPVLPGLAGSTWDDSLDSPWLTDTGFAGWRAAGVDNTPGGTAMDTFLVLGNQTVAEEGQVPGGLAGGATDVWQNFDIDDWFTTPDGQSWLAQGDTDAAANDDIVVFNGQVVLQEGVPVPGSSFAEAIDLSGIVTVWMDEAGTWFAHGNNAGTEQDWLVRNGVVVATSDAGDPIVPGSTETWSDTDYPQCFFAVDGNIQGAFVFGGVTNALSTANGVLVYDDGTGARVVVCRENDPVDIDGNGQFDDDRFFNTFGNDDVRLLPGGSILFTATLRNGAGVATDQGVFRLDPVSASCTFRNGSGSNPADFACTTNPVLGGIWNSTIQTNANTLQTAILFAVFPDPGTPTPFGELLIGNAPPPVALTGNGAHAIQIPTSAPLIGASFPTQGLRVDNVGGTPTAVLLNALDLVIGS